MIHRGSSTLRWMKRPYIINETTRVSSCDSWIFGGTISTSSSIKWRRARPGVDLVRLRVEQSRQLREDRSIRPSAHSSTSPQRVYDDSVAINPSFLAKG